MTMTKYRFDPNKDKTICEIYLARFDKWIGRIELAPGGRVLQTFGPDVMWLPVNSALATLGVRSEGQEEQTLRELGF